MAGRNTCATIARLSAVSQHFLTSPEPARSRQKVWGTAPTQQQLGTKHWQKKRSGKRRGAHPKTTKTPTARRTQTRPCKPDAWPDQTAPHPGSFQALCQKLIRTGLATRRPGQRQAPALGFPKRPQNRHPSAQHPSALGTSAGAPRAAKIWFQLEKAPKCIEIAPLRGASPFNVLEDAREKKIISPTLALLAQYFFV